MSDLLDSDHSSILIRSKGAEYGILSLRLAEIAESEIFFSIVSFHEHMYGAYSYLNKYKTSAN